MAGTSSVLSQVFEVLKRHAFLVLLVAVISAIFFNGFYNRYLHPLRRFPGPFWATVSDFWKFRVVFTNSGHIRAPGLHQKHGPVMRVAPNLLVFNDPKLLPQVYHRKADKTDTYSAAILGEITPPFQTQRHDQHAVKRKRVAHSYSMTNLRKFERDIDNTIVELVRSLRAKYAATGEPLDWADWARWFVYDAVSQLAFSRPIGFIREARDVQGLIKAFHNMAVMAGVVAVLPWLVNPVLQHPLFKKYLMPRAGDRTGTGQIMQYRDDMLADRLANPEVGKHGDLLDNLLQAKNADGSPMDIEDIKSECFVLMVAAPDTTSAFICPFVNNVVQDARVYATLMAEVDAFEAAGRLSSPVVTFDETNAMPYFMACVKETLRCNPSTPFIMPRYVPAGGMTIKGIHAPAGTEIGADPHITNRDKAVFGEDADVFRPERWLNEEHAREMDKYMFSFGFGARVCLGKHAAHLQFQKLCCQVRRPSRGLAHLT